MIGDHYSRRSCPIQPRRAGSADGEIPSPPTPDHQHGVQSCQRLLKTIPRRHGGALFNSAPRRVGHQAKRHERSAATPRPGLTANMGLGTCLRLPTPIPHRHASTRLLSLPVWSHQRCPLLSAIRPSLPSGRSVAICSAHSKSLGISRCDYFRGRAGDLLAARRDAVARMLTARHVGADEPRSPLGRRRVIFYNPDLSTHHRGPTGQGGRAASKPVISAICRAVGYSPRQGTRPRDRSFAS
jgi:hypothetical protein